MGEGSVSEHADASWSNQELSHYLVCVVEADASHPASSSQDPLGSQAAQADVEIGVVAVEISTGDVLYGQFRYNVETAIWQQQHSFQTASRYFALLPCSSSFSTKSCQPSCNVLPGQQATFQQLA